MRRPLLPASVLAVALFLLSSIAGACTCWRPEPDAYLAASSLIFRGTVVSVTDAAANPGMPGAGSVTLRGRQQGKVARFKILTPIKGPVQDEVDIAFTQSDGANCGWSFKEGQAATVFASRFGTGYSTGMCMMIPYSSHTSRGGSYHDAVEGYRLRRLELAEKQKTQPGVALFREQADFFMKYRDHEDAARALSELLRLQPKDVRGLTDRGNVHYQQVQYEAALADYVAVLAIDERNTDARRGRSLSLVKLGRLGELGPGDRDFSGFDSGYRHKLDFSGLDLQGAVFRDAKLNRINFSGADLRGADFSGANMHTCDFTGARLDGAKFDGLKGAYDTKFQKARLVKASFRGASLFHTRLNDSVLDGADFSKARLERASIENASLVGANFTGTSVVATDIAGAKLNGVCYDGTTRWPDNFDPATAGARVCP